MASPRLRLFFLFAFVLLRGEVADGRSYPVSTQVLGKETQEDVMKKMERIRVKEQDGCGSSPSTTDSSDNLYQNKKKILNVKYKWINKRDKSEGGHLLNDEGSRFIAFNADYFVAKPHPPKNNGGGKYL